MIALKNILVATDFGEPSAVALEYGRALARASQGTLHVIHVVDSAAVQGMMLDSSPANCAVILREIEDSARRQLKEAIREDDRRELNAKPSLLTGIRPADGIVSYAHEEDIDLIVMGTHGRTGWSHVLMGSVAEKIVRSAPCPVLTVKHPQHEFVAPDALQIVAPARTGERK